jgi:hypothetical protein
MNCGFLGSGERVPGALVLGASPRHDPGILGGPWAKTWQVMGICLTRNGDFLVVEWRLSHIITNKCNLTIRHKCSLTIRHDDFTDFKNNDES